MSKDIQEENEAREIPIQTDTDTTSEDASNEAEKTVEVGNDDQTTEETPETDGTEAETPDELQQAREEAAQFKDQWMRSVAELQNFRKRTQRDVQDMRLRAGERIIRQLLDPVDNLARAISVAESPDANGDEGIVQGVKMIYQQLMTVLEREQVTLMESVGQTFDPMKHEAMMMVEKDDVPDMTIIEEIERGYMLGEKPLKHAKVVVSKASAESASAAEENEESSDDSENNEKK